MNRPLHRLGWWVMGLLALLVMALGAVMAWQMLRSEEMGVSAPVSDRDAQLRQGRYLARAGNCMGCHTARGGAEYAGGRAIATPFGTLYTSNITPDRHTGIGAWSADDFWRALHHGRGRDGRFLYPAFPYTSYTRMSRTDSDALFSYLQSLAPVAQANQPHALRFPYDQRALLAFWRALYFSRAASSLTAAAMPSGTAVLIWCRGPAIAAPATARAMAWGPAPIRWHWPGG